MADISNILKGLGLAGSLGFLIGLGLMSYIDPTEPGGTFLLIAVPTAIFAVVGGIIGALRGTKQKKQDKDA